MPPKKKVAAKKKDVVPEEVTNEYIEAPTIVEHVVVEDASLDNKEEHVVLHLPILSERLSELTYVDTILEYNPNLPDPIPYNPMNQFISEHDMIEQKDVVEPSTPSRLHCDASDVSHEKTEAKTQQKCFWCCYDVGHEVYGMPIRYDALNKNFAMYGTFCSLECASAFNFSYHLGSDRAWEIHSWIQMLGKRFGYKEPIRPAPSRYLLEMFGGPMTIEEFRQAHKSQERTMVMNIPPLISVPSQMEMINTSFISSEKKKKPTVVEKKRTIDTKMKLLIQDGDTEQ